MNRGTGTAAPFNVQFEVDGTALRIMEVPALAPNATTTIDFPGWAARPGTHTARATADVPSRIGEPREDDNTLERRFNVGPDPLGLADLHVLGVRFEPSLPRAGQAVTFIAKVQNTGGNVLDGFAVTFGVDRANVGQTMVGGLPSGETVEVRSPAWTATQRRHVLHVTVDAPNAVPEKDEANNLHTRLFAVRGRATRP